MTKSIDLKVIDRDIKDSFRRIVRSRGENGKGKSSGEILAEGVDFFVENCLGEKKLEIFDAITLAKSLHIIDAVKSEEDGLKLVQSIPNSYELDDGKKGHLYFERRRKGIIVGYSTSE